MGGLLAPSAPLGRCIALPKPSNSRPMHLSCPQLTPYDHLSRLAPRYGGSGRPRGGGGGRRGRQRARRVGGSAHGAPGGCGGRSCRSARAIPIARRLCSPDNPESQLYRYVNSRGVPRACCVPGTVPSGPGPIGRWSRDMLRPADVLGRPAALHLSLLYGPDVILT